MDMTVIKGGKHMINRYGHSKKIFAACICPKCDHVTKVEWDIDADKNVENDEIIVPHIEKQKLEKCPVCSGKLLPEADYFICGENAASEKLIADFWGAFRKNNIESFRKEANSVIEESELNACTHESIENTDVVKNNLNNLKAYLRYAVNVESAVRFYEEHLINLKLELRDNNKKFIADTAKEKRKRQNDAAAVKKKIKKLEEKIQAVEGAFESTDFTAEVKVSKIRKPSEPTYISVTAISAPEYPELKKPGLFNKKKIEEENAALIANYNAQRALYLAECEKIERENAALKEKYEKKLCEYKGKQKQQRLEIQEKAELLKEEARKEKELEIAKIKEEIAALSRKKPAKKVENTVSLFLLNEIKTAEMQLAAAAKARATFYGYNIIYPKYRNYIAVATFCEYLESGRCAALEGTSGAYNLYETECMNNLIVSQLTVIADKLESIKQHQLLMYREMKAMNQNLKMLNETMKDAVRSINSIAASMSDMQSYLADISANAKDIKHANTQIAANTAISAHYSAVTAHYAKLNCELTNALGFMVAFK